MVAGLGAVVIAGIDHLGGWGAVTAKVDQALMARGTRPAQWWSFVGPGWAVVLAMFFSATIHTPAASVYVNFSSAARRERDLLPAFLLGGAVASIMPVLAGVVGMLTLAKYGSAEGLSSYRAITQLALDIHPVVGGVALAAVLAAIISSGGPILLASSTMVVRDWLPKRWFPNDAAEARAMRVVTVVYGALGGLIASLGEIGSVLDLVLLAFAMVVPPAVALGYVLYWKRATEPGCYWGMLSGYGGGLVWYAMIRWTEFVELTVLPDPGVLQRMLYTCFGEGAIDPSYVTTLIPLLVVPIVSLLGDDDPGSNARSEFFGRLRGETSS